MTGANVVSGLAFRVGRHARADSRPLRRGDQVRVRPAEEILATLDDHGRLDGLPFMPEMLKFCGQTARVYRRADKTCDTIDYRQQRRLLETVHLEGLRCDGQAHGGCQARCLMFWKEAWLEPVGGTAGRHAPASMPPAKALTQDALASLAGPFRDPGVDGERYMCQATELSRASTEMAWWSPGQYIRDVRSGNVSLRQEVRALALWLFVRVQKRLVNGSKVPFMKGRLTKTPRRTLDLQPGELVRVRSRREIGRTLDTDNRNRGLSFDAEMLRYTGGQYRVQRRVERIVDEKTGRMARLPGDCIVLDGVFCTSEYHRNCPRAIDIYWREIWLERAERAVPSGPQVPAGAVASVAGPTASGSG